VQPVSLHVAERACRRIRGENQHADCVFDVQVTGNRGFARTYLQSQQVEAGADATTITVTDDTDTTEVEEPVTFSATVLVGNGVPTGKVQFMIDDEDFEEPVELDSNGQASLTTSRLRPGRHEFEARYIPSQGSVFLPSISPDEEHTVTGEDE
jgi:hypothetical protein